MHETILSMTLVSIHVLLSSKQTCVMSSKQYFCSSTGVNMYMDVVWNNDPYDLYGDGCTESLHWRVCLTSVFYFHFCVHVYITIDFRHICAIFKCSKNNSGRQTHFKCCSWLNKPKWALRYNKLLLAMVTNVGIQLNCWSANVTYSNLKVELINITLMWDLTKTLLVGKI